MNPETYAYGIGIFCMIVSILGLLWFCAEFLNLFICWLRRTISGNFESESVTPAPVGNTDKKNDGNDASFQENIEMQRF